MITFKGELPMDHEPCIKGLVENWAEDYKKNYLDICEHTTELTEIQYCREIAWDWIEEKLISEKLKMERIR